MLIRSYVLTDSILSNIPRLEAVRGLIALCSPHSNPMQKIPPSLEQEVAVLRIAFDFDDLVSNGTPLQTALDTMRCREHRYDEKLLARFADFMGAMASAEEVREIPISELREGMVLADDIRISNGLLLVPRGFTVSSSCMERVRNFGSSRIKEPLRVVVSRENVSTPSEPPGS